MVLFIKYIATIYILYFTILKKFGNIKVSKGQEKINFTEVLKGGLKMVNLEFNHFLKVVKNIANNLDISIIKNYTSDTEKYITIEDVNENNINEVTFMLENNVAEKCYKILKLLDDFENIIIDRFNDFICITYFKY